MAIRRGWLVFFIILGLFVFFGLIFIMGIRAAFEDKPVVKKDTVLRLDLGGLVTEHFP
ncbi:hypothetical protein GWN42_04135, partial [candidate division KSB1 bacterium]|nr:hypothetical protein [candidate division KSB1 bacterium]